jgi:hypothetical protein
MVMQWSTSTSSESEEKTPFVPFPTDVEQERQEVWGSPVELFGYDSEQTLSFPFFFTWYISWSTR